MIKRPLVHILISLSILFSCGDDNGSDGPCWDPSRSGSILEVSDVCDMLDLIWGPGSNSVLLESAINLSTTPGVGWSQEFGGVFVTSFSVLSSTESDFISEGSNVDVRITGPENVVIEVWNLETLSVVSYNRDTPGEPVDFIAQPNNRYGGFAWYADNAQMDLQLDATALE